MPGQKLVDNLGNIYTVIGADPDVDNAVIIDPPVPATVAETGLPGYEPWEYLHQVVFTTQIPAAVEVFRVRAVDPKE